MLLIYLKIALFCIARLALFDLIVGIYSKIALNGFASD